MEKINLYERRDFGSNFNTTFQFIKQNYGTICKTLCYFIPLFLIIAYFFKLPENMFSNVGYYDYLSPAYFINMGIGYILYIVGMILINTYVMSYVIEYAESKDGKVSQSDVWNRLKKNILPLLLCSIMYIAAVSIGTIFCIIPGIVIMVYWCFFGYAYTAHDETITGSFSNSYYLVKESWWITFGYMLIFALGVGIVQSVFAMPVYFVMFGQMLNIEFLSSDAFSYFATLISYLGYLFLSPIIIIAMGVMYYSLRTDVYGVDISSAIDQIGTFDPDKE